MTNKHVLQIIAGFLAFFSFFASWMTSRVGDYKPLEIVNSTVATSMPFRILFIVLPIVGLYNIYLGFIKKHSQIATIANLAVCGYLMLLVTVNVSMHDDYFKGYTTGYYLGLFSVVVSAYSFFIFRKEINTQQESETM